MKFKEIYSLIPTSFRKRGVLVAVTIFIMALLDFAGVVVFIPVLAGVLEDGGDPVSVLPVAAGAMAFIILKSLVIIRLTRYRSKFAFSLYTELSEQVLKQFLSKGLIFIKQSNSVDLANKVNAVTMTFTSGIILSLMNVASNIVLLVIILTSLFIYDPLPTLALILIIGPFMFFYSFFLRNKMKELGVIENTARRDQARSVYELFKGYPEYYINAAEERQLGIFHTNISKISQVRLKTESYSAASTGFMEITVMLSIIILMMLSMTSSFGISMTFGIFALSAMKILPSVRGLIGYWQLIQSSSYSVDVLREIFDNNSGAPEGAIPTDATAATSVHIVFKDTIKLENVGFGYEAGERIFQGLSIEIGKGEYVGIKGRSGVGKTTLFNILMGFFTPQEGGLYVDGVRIGPENVRAWQELIGYVPQDVFLVNGTFVENVAFGQDAGTADRGKIELILKRMGLWEWISSLPHGMDSRIAEAGNSISGGQKQRLGIARALYKGASVLFFDEATSSVDTEAETEINDFISELSRSDKSLTVIVIAHRHETLASCRRIIDMDSLLTLKTKA